MTDSLKSRRPSDAAPDRELAPFPASWTGLVAAIFAACEADPNGLCMADSSLSRMLEGSDDKKELIYLTRKQFLQRAACVARVLSGKLNDSPMVGIMLPPSLGCALTNVAVLMLKKVPINLPYGTNTEIVNHCIDTCSVTQVISEPILMAKTKIQPKGEIIVASKMKDEVDWKVKAWAGWALMGPRWKQAIHFPGLRSTWNDIATVLFTSGSTGLPKGAQHTHEGLLSNTRAVQMQFAFGQEKMLGAAPAYHALGLTGCILAPLVLGKDTDSEGNERSITVVYHANSLDAKTICRLVKDEQITVFLSIPSMMDKYLKYATKELFASLRQLILGAEKLEEPLRKLIKEITGIEPEEAYGTTEFGPLISANVNAYITINGQKVWGNRPGSAGLPVPGTVIKIVDMDTGAVIPRRTAGSTTEEFGWIYAWGQQKMVGYLNQPEQTAASDKDGWYITGDYGYVDEDGFLIIVGRLVIKSAGEIIPPFTVRGKILEVTGVKDSQLFVIGAKDSKRGERPAVLYISLGNLTPTQVTAALKDQLPALWIPKATDFAQLDGEALPVGSTGKLDLLALKKLAAEKFPEA